MEPPDAGRKPSNDPRLLAAMRASTLFAKVDDEKLARIADTMSRVPFDAGAVLGREGEPQRRMLIVTRGSVTRTREGGTGRDHQVTETLGRPGSLATIGGLHVLRGEPTYGTSSADGPGEARRTHTRRGRSG
jgi:CRP-like cAMP-binding protein